MNDFPHFLFPCFAVLRVYRSLKLLILFRSDPIFFVKRSKSKEIIFQALMRSDLIDKLMLLLGWRNSIDLLDLIKKKILP